MRSGESATRCPFLRSISINRSFRVYTITRHQRNGSMLRSCAKKEFLEAFGKLLIQLSAKVYKSASFMRRRDQCGSLHRTLVCSEPEQCVACSATTDAANARCTARRGELTLVCRGTWKRAFNADNKKTKETKTPLTTRNLLRCRRYDTAKRKSGRQDTTRSKGNQDVKTPR
ncbi:hypothetical protein M514_09440 [Trichuris suis]|uniref:Uncharacterized protein n=1 Tax=Trichuris suis TaxID=68888 RepID=A0A085LXP7_9BILA|nr:hypothetical protein M513_09440 [Trichuris suis]KFD65090.1 hypothetical protein M514_09440 [Trichuris suis]